MSEKAKIGFISFGAIVAIGVVAGMPPIPQDVSYHFFADTKGWGYILNAENVLSNIAFVIAGIVGLWKMRSGGTSIVIPIWRAFFSSVILVGVGSAYYHWAPSNDTLVWDRLPMTLSFAALTAGVCAERLGERYGRFFFLPLVVCGVWSVYYWWLSELSGDGDLRLYILVQYLPMLIVPLVILFFPKPSKQNRPYWFLLGSYIVAKLFELNDGLIFNLTNHIVSGHALKHVAAAIGIMLMAPSRSLSTDEAALERSEGSSFLLTKRDNL